MRCYYSLWHNLEPCYLSECTFSHYSVLLLAFDLERVLTSEDEGWVGKDSGGEGEESGTNSGGLTTLILTSLLLSFFCLKCLSQWLTNVSSLTKVLLHTLQ